MDNAIKLMTRNTDLIFLALDFQDLKIDSRVDCNMVAGFRQRWTFFQSVRSEPRLFLAGKAGLVGAQLCATRIILAGNQVIHRQRDHVVGFRPIPQTAIAAFTLLEVLNRFEHVDAAKIGPEPVSDEDLRVRDLP